MERTSRQKLIQRFEDWWKHDNHGLPLMKVKAFTDAPRYPAEDPGLPGSAYEKHADADYILKKKIFDESRVLYYADAYPHLDVNLGPGSLALYLGAEPRFAMDTVWFESCIKDPLTHPRLTFDAENQWFRHHTEMLKKLTAAGGDLFRVDIPDIIENIDIYAAMRGPQDALYDIMDEPEKVLDFIEQIDDTYFAYYDAFCDIVRDRDGAVSYTAFNILGMGRVAKVQCDFCAMLSPAHFRKFVQPFLKKQTEKLDHSVYHLDGPDAIRHIPALMEIEHLDALQWTCGAGKPQGADPCWNMIYDQVAAAGKSLWISVESDGCDNWIRDAERLIERYGKKSLYLLFPFMSQRDAEKLMNHAHKHWEKD